MAKYKSKPVTIEAIQLSWRNWGDVCDFTEKTICEENPGWYITEDEASETCGEPGPSYIAINVTTARGYKAVVRHGDWIIKDCKPGTFYPCKPEVFKQKYEPEDH